MKLAATGHIILPAGQATYESQGILFMSSVGFRANTETNLTEIYAYKCGLHKTIIPLKMTKKNEFVKIWFNKSRKPQAR